MNKNHQQVLEHYTRVRRQELLEEVSTKAGNQVQAGPYKGMTVLRESNWGDGDAITKMLGVYEQELHSALETIISAKPTVMVNVGCAEGFYAVGFAMRSPSTQVIAVDLDHRTLNIAGQNALANQLDNVELCDSCTADNLEYLFSDKEVTAVISDCEGYETELLDPAVAPSLKNSYMLIECHDMFKAGITDTLTERFKDTHTVTKITQGIRNPHALSLLDGYSETDKWAAVNEIRATSMHWLFMVPNK